MSWEAIYEVVRRIPEGRVTTYGSIANYLELGSARVVGWALRQSLGTEAGIPAHRVVNRNGELTGRGHFNPPQLMQELLENEGIVVKEHRVQNFSAHFWQPE